ncbi:MAG: AAA family ATPase [Leptolyngbyaceae cyanobacterium MO_188.B28]|nr:AAA family ATPase [Leptolyngbyaceae cyanobacterium MO_188.B28]
MVANRVKLLNYSLTKEIYVGLNTVVYRGIRNLDQQPVILKILHNDYPHLNELVQFRNQYAIAQTLNLSGVVKPYSLENYRNGYVLVMEDFGGVSLTTYMNSLAEKSGVRSQESGVRSQESEVRSRESGVRSRELGINQSKIQNPKSKIQSPPSPLPLNEFFPIAIQTADILNGLYRHRVIHKDFKPANLLIHPETKQIKLIDFSIASLLPRETQEIQNPSGLEGTLAYISPEQTGRMNRGIDYRTDFYSLGVTFYELLTGQVPFLSNDPMELVHSHIAIQPVPVHSLNPNIPASLSDIVEKLMAKNAEDRYQTALGLKHDLETCLRQWRGTGAIAPFELGQKDISNYFSISEKLYGREQEVSALLSAFERVSEQASGENCELFLVAGSSGVGKTAVVNEIHKPIVRQRGYFIKGKFDQFRRNIPFLAIVQAFQDLMGQLLTENKAQVEHWKTEILEALGENGQVIIDVIPEVELLIGEQPAVAELEPSASQNRFSLLFQKFIRVFPRAAHPLVLFLDDLQWADSASLQVLQALMAETETHHLLVIGAYRDNEVSPVHPLMQTLEHIGNSKVSVNTITLEPLNQTDLNGLISDTLNCSAAAANPLTQLVIAKTKGNPFFSNQFLKTLHAEGHIRFDFDSGRWQWDVAQIRTLSLTDDVVEFVANQLKKLPETTQQVLSLAACIGNQFDLRSLALANSKTKAETTADLWQALQAEVILLGNEVYKANQDDNSALRLSDPDAIANHPNEWLLASDSLTYKFLHDRVQQAAYSLIPQDQKPSTHLSIGRLLLHCTPPEEREERIFELVNQLNHGVDLITYRQDRQELAQLNLLAGQKAKAATANAAALDYLQVGLGLLVDDCWRQQYKLALALHEEATEAAYLNGDFDRMEQWAQTVLHQANSPLERVRVYEIRIQAYTSQNKLLDAIAIAREALMLFGMELPENPSQSDIQRAFQETAKQVAGKTIDDLMNLPLMTATDQLAIMRIVLSMIPATFIATPNLCPLIILSQVNASARYGNSPESAFFYASYGFLLNGVLQDIETASRFGRLALKLIQKINFQGIKARTYYVLGAFIIHGKSHIRETLPLLIRGYQTGLETGNLEFVGYCVKEICQYSYLMGQELIGLEKEIRAYSDILSNLHQLTSLNYCRICWQATLNLIGSVDNPCILVGDAYDEEQSLTQLIEANDLNGLHYFYLHKLILCYFFREFPQAMENAAKVEQYLAGGTGFLTVPVFYFYDSLTVLEVCSSAETVPNHLLTRVETNQAKMQHWAHHAPMNFLHKFHLIEAEQYRVRGQNLEAMACYDRAITLAKENGYLNEEALSCELAARFYLEWDKQKIASVYLTDAYYCYARWGATAKVKDLENHYPQLLASVISQEKSYSKLGFSASSTLPSVKRTTGINISKTLDIESVLKASHSLSGEVKLEKLLTTLMQVVIENAGAEKCIIILPNDNNWIIVAQGLSTDREATTLIQSVPLESSKAIPQSVVNYVLRTSSPLIIDDAQTETNFLNDPYVIKQQPKSILCMPILNQGKMLGILYLENNITYRAFTHHRLEVLRLLTTQAAISLKNAALYNTLETKIRQRTQELHEKNLHLSNTLEELKKTQIQLIQTEKMSSLGQMVAGVAHEINNPINFIYANLDHARNYVADLLDLLTVYQQEYPHSNPQIEKKTDEIDLDFLMEDLPKIFSSMEVGGERIRNIVLGLRNFSRLDEAQMKPVDIHEGIDSTLMILHHRFREYEVYSPIEIIKEYGHLPLISCYANQLNQVIMNILNNAIDALLEEVIDQEKGEGNHAKNSRLSNPYIRIRTELADENTARIRISDNGPGMTQETRSKIFDPFFTTKPVGSGTGLGLAISYQIVVNKHKGQLICHSSLGEGTEFILEIPIGESQD